MSRRPGRQLNKDGSEIADPVPLAASLKFKKPPTLQEQVRRLMQREMQEHIHGLGHETFEEANDFDVGDDFDPNSPWEEEFYGQFEEDVRLEQQYQAEKRRPQKPAKRISRSADDEADEQPGASAAPRKKKSSKKIARPSDEDDDE